MMHSVFSPTLILHNLLFSNAPGGSACFQEHLKTITHAKCGWANRVYYVEDITRWREDMNFIFEWQNNILLTRCARS